MLLMYACLYSSVKLEPSCILHFSFEFTMSMHKLSTFAGPRIVYNCPSSCNSQSTFECWCRSISSRLLWNQRSFCGCGSCKSEATGSRFSEFLTYENYYIKLIIIKVKIFTLRYLFVLLWINYVCFKPFNLFYRKKLTCMVEPCHWGTLSVAVALVSWSHFWGYVILFLNHFRGRLLLSD